LAPRLRAPLALWYLVALLSARKPPLDTSGAPGRGRGDWTQALREAAPYMGLGTSLAVTVLLGVGAGYWLDEKLGTKPWLLLLGAASGLAVALYHFFRSVTGIKR
jgi:hypothetical protein